MISAAALPADGQTAPNWPAAGLPPHPGQTVLLADPGLVGKPNLDSRTACLRRPDSL